MEASDANLQNVKKDIENSLFKTLPQKEFLRHGSSRLWKVSDYLPLLLRFTKREQVKKAILIFFASAASLHEIKYKFEKSESYWLLINRVLY
jgi:hypothetical protein